MKRWTTLVGIAVAVIFVFAPMVLKADGRFDPKGTPVFEQEPMHAKQVEHEKWSTDDRRYSPESGSDDVIDEGEDTILGGGGSDDFYTDDYYTSDSEYGEYQGSVMSDDENFPATTAKKVAHSKLADIETVCAVMQAMDEVVSCNLLIKCHEIGHFQSSSWAQKIALCRLLK